MNEVKLLIDGKEIQSFTSNIPDIEVSVPTSVMRNGKSIAVTGTGRAIGINPGLYGASIKSVVTKDIESIATLEMLLGMDFSEIELKLLSSLPFHSHVFYKHGRGVYKAEWVKLVEDERKQFQPCNPYFKREGWRK